MQKSLPHIVVQALSRALEVLGRTEGGIVSVVNCRGECKLSEKFYLAFEPSVRSGILALQLYLLPRSTMESIRYQLLM
jgi:hypothetical protein